jgi:hypothetical protein
VSTVVAQAVSDMASPSNCPSSASRKQGSIRFRISQKSLLSQIADGTVNPEPIKCPYITTVQLDSDLSNFMERLIDTGVVAKHGVVLIESLPESRYVVSFTLNNRHTNQKMDPGP